MCLAPNDPGIVDLVSKAYAGRKAAAALAAGQGAIGDEERQALARAVADGQAADSKVYGYADWLISTVNIRSPEERAAHPGECQTLTRAPSTPSSTGMSVTRL